MKLSKMTGTIEQRVCLFGPPKVGKTLIALKLAEKYNVILFDLENGSSVGLQIPDEWKDRVEVIKIRDSKVYPIAVETMMKVIKGDAVNICIAHSKVACPICSKNGADVERVCLKEVKLDTVVVIDSLTQFTQSALAHITKAEADDYKLLQDDWGNLKQIIEKFMTQVQVAPYNIVCISHEEEVKFEDGRTKIVPVAGSSNSSRNTAKYFDHVIYCNVVNKKHVVGSATDYSMSVLTGSRTNVKLEANKEATLLDVFTNWKLPNFGMPMPGNSDEVKAMVQEAVTNEDTDINNYIPPREVAATATGYAGAADARTPAQIALDNLRNRNKK